MSTIDVAIRKRRSIRKYQPTPVSNEAVLEVLEAAGWAPSAHNSQPWRFIILTSKALKMQLAQAMANAWEADVAKEGLPLENVKRVGCVRRFSEAPVLIVACILMEEVKRFPDAKRQECERDLANQGLGAAVQNLLLAAHCRRLGACWYCAPAFCRETVRQVLNIPLEVEPQALITMGYPAEETVVPPRKGLGEFCFWNGWGKGLVIP